MVQMPPGMDLDHRPDKRTVKRRQPKSLARGAGRLATFLFLAYPGNRPSLHRAQRAFGTVRFPYNEENRVAAHKEIPMEHTPDVLRFERIEASQETTAKALATLSTESTSAFGNLNAAQRHTLEIIKVQDFRLTALARSAESLVQVQTLQGQNLQNLHDILAVLAVAQTKTEILMGELSVKSAETQGKLDALIDMWDRSIRERAAKNGTPEPPPAA